MTVGLAGDDSLVPVSSVRANTGGPAAVMGLGAVTAFAWSTEGLAVGLNSGRSTVGRPERFVVQGHRTELASEVPPLDSCARSVASSKNWEALSTADRFAVSAARQAWNQCFGGPEEDNAEEDNAEEGDSEQGEMGNLAEGLSPSSVGVFFGGSTAGMAEAEVFFARELGKEKGSSRLRSLVSQQLNGPGDAVARELGVAGPVVSFSSACASGTLALGAALDAIRRGEVEVAVAGGSDSLCQMTYAGFNALRAVDPELSRPFRADRAGLNLGEGAGALVLVNDEWAKVLADQGRAPLAWLAGAGASCDAYHMTAPHPRGEGAAGSMEAALRDGDCPSEVVNFVNAHGTGTLHNDSAEGAALGSVLPTQDGTGCRVPVTSVKGAIGHLLGSAGAVEAVATVLALQAGAVQPTAGPSGKPMRGLADDVPVDQVASDQADPDLGVDLVLGEERKLQGGCQAGLSNSFAFGGANASLLFLSCRPEF